MTKVLLLGDIGWPHLYHLGDEAMTEAAIEQLRSRGIDDITLVSAVPSVATERYGLPAVERIGFSLKWSRNGLQGTLDKVSWTLESDYRGHDGVTAMIDAVRACDSVVIAGGGNMNSHYVHHLFERTAVARIAAHLGKPLFVTSQTVGPLRAADEPLVAEIVSSAVCFGARDIATRDLLVSLGGDPDRVVHTMDDAFLLEPSEEDRHAVRDLGVVLEMPPVIVSIQAPAIDLELDEEEFFVRMAQTLDDFAQRFDTDVALLPHAGSFDPDVVKDDVATHAALAARSESGRIIALPMLTARQAIALTDVARFTLSTRYHPVVFGPARSTPAFGLVPDLFSLVRMRGALENVGLGSYALPLDAWLDGPFSEIIEDGLRPGFEEHASAVASLRRSEQKTWWDALVAALQHGVWNRPEDLAPVESRVVSERHERWLADSIRQAAREGLLKADLRWSALLLREANESARSKLADAETKRQSLSDDIGHLRDRLLELETVRDELTAVLTQRDDESNRARTESLANLEDLQSRLDVVELDSARYRRENARLRNRRVVRFVDRLGAIFRRV